MNKKIISLYILVILSIFTILPTCAAANKTAGAYNKGEDITVNSKSKVINLRIDGSSENIFNDNKFNAVYTGDTLTVLEAIEQAVGENNITTINSYHGGKYISKINNEEECILDNGEYAGWQYRVNDVEPFETINEYILEENDRVVVYYGTLNTEYYKEEGSSNLLLSDEYVLDTQNKNFNDIKDRRIDLLISMGIIKGEPDNNFYPENNVTRAEVITMLANLSREEIKKSNQIVFNDTPINEWYFDTIMWGYNKGIISGYQNKFEPDEFITREDLAVMLTKYLEIIEGYQFEELEPDFNDNIEMYDYSKKSIANLANLKLVTGEPNNKFAPKSFATRYEMVIILTNFLDTKYDDVNL